LITEKYICSECSTPCRVEIDAPETSYPISEGRMRDRTRCVMRTRDSLVIKEANFVMVSSMTRYETKPISGTQEERIDSLVRRVRVLEDMVSAIDIEQNKKIRRVWESIEEKLRGM